MGASSCALRELRQVPCSCSANATMATYMTLSIDAFEGFDTAGLRKAPEHILHEINGIRTVEPLSHECIGRQPLTQQCCVELHGIERPVAHGCKRDRSAMSSRSKSASATCSAESTPRSASSMSPRTRAVA